MLRFGCCCGFGFTYSSFSCRFQVFTSADEYIDVYSYYCAAGNNFHRRMGGVTCTGNIVTKKNNVAGLKMKKIAIVFGLILAGLFSGCGIVSVIGTPTYHEQKIPAEFNLADRAKNKIVVFTERSRDSGADAKVPEQIDNAVKNFLIKKAKIKDKYFISTDDLSVLQSGASDFLQLSPPEIGKKLDAGLILYIQIENYRLYQMAESGYYSGSLIARSLLFDTASNKAVWPIDKQGRIVRIKVDYETKGYDKAAARLTAATAHCIARYLYDCPRDRFRTRDEQSEYRQLEEINKYCSFGVDSHFTPNYSNAINEIMKLTRFRNLGSTALHLAYVAKGSFSGSMITLAKLWDIAAGALLIENAGGIITDITGNNIFPVDMQNYTGQNYQVLAANKKTHSEFLKIFKT